MRLLRALGEDFLTYDFLDYTFQSRPLLVQGLNLTDEGQVTNGVGKTALQTIIEHCITASNSRGVRDAELITYGKDSSRIQLYAECDIRRERLHIDWEIKMKGANVLVLKTQSYDSENWEPVKFSNSDDGKKRVIEWFAISKEDLFNYYIINNTRFKSFFKSSNTEKVALINRFSDASVIDGIDDIDTADLNKKYVQAKTDFDEVVGKIKYAEEKLEQEQLRDLKKEKEELEKSIDIDISDIQEEIEDIQDSVIPNIREGKKTFEEKIKEQNDLKTVLDKETLEVDLSIKNVKEELKKANLDLTVAKDLVDKFKVTDWEEKRTDHNKTIKQLKEESTNIKSDKDKKEGQEKQVLTLLKSIEVSLSGVITCPSCKHEFLLSDDLDSLKEKEVAAKTLKETIEKVIVKKSTLLEETKSKISAIELKLSEINKNEQGENSSKNELNIALNKINKKVNEIERELANHEAEYTTIANKETARLLKIKNLNADIAGIEVKVKEQETLIVNFKRDIEVLQASKKNVKVDSNKEQIDQIKLEIKNLNKEKLDKEKEHNKIGDEIYLLNQWIKNFKGFKMHLANQSLEVMEYHVNRYLNEMGIDLIVRFEGFKVKADNSIKEEINAIIIRNGVERSFSSFSGGERARLLYASILANRFLINESNIYGGLDFLMADETFEGLDSEGFISLLNSSKLLCIPILLVTHVYIEDKENEDIITIIKENGISRIE